MTLMTAKWMGTQLRCCCEIKTYTVHVSDGTTLVECNMCDAVWEMGAERKPVAKPVPKATPFGFMAMLCALVASQEPMSWPWPEQQR